MNDIGNDQGFLGTGWSFPPEFNRHARTVKMVSEEADIRESLRILMLTSPGERTLQPAYGCGLKRMVFEQMNESAETEMKDLIERAVLFFEARITLNKIDIGYEDLEKGLLTISLNFTVRTTNSRSNMVFPFYFREGTSLHV